MLLTPSCDALVKISYDEALDQAVFSTRLTKSLINLMLAEATEEFSNLYEKQKLPSDAPRGYIVRTGVEKLLLQFAFDFFLSTIIANKCDFSPGHYKSSSTNILSSATPLGFHLGIGKRQAQHLRFRQIDTEKTFYFLRRRSAKEEKFICGSQFDRGLRYFITALNMPLRQEGLKAILLLSTIEALLTKDERELPKAAIEARIRALLGPSIEKEIGQLRKLYRFRSDFLHGKSNLGVWVGESFLLHPKEGDKEMIMFRGEYAAKAQAIATQLLQEFVLREASDISFATVVAD